MFPFRLTYWRISIWVIKTWNKMFHFHSHDGSFWFSVQNFQFLGFQWKIKIFCVGKLLIENHFCWFLSKYSVEKHIFGHLYFISHSVYVLAYCWLFFDYCCTWSRGLHSYSTIWWPGIFFWINLEPCNSYTFKWFFTMCIIRICHYRISAGQHATLLPAC